jgi:hypothetical protein
LRQSGKQLARWHHQKFSFCHFKISEEMIHLANLPLVKFLSQLFTVLKLLPSMATQSPFTVPIRQQSAVYCA